MRKCKWGHNGFHFEHHEYWQTECGNMFQFNNYGPEEANFKWCPYCGGEIEVTEE